MRQFREAGFDVARVHDAEAAPVAEAVRLLYQDALSQAVKGRDPEPALTFTTEQTAHALLHFACGPVGKGNRANVIRCKALVDQPRDLARNNAGFTAAGTGQHETGPIDTLDRLALRLIEIFQVQG